MQQDMAWSKLLPWRAYAGARFSAACGKDSTLGAHTRAEKKYNEKRGGKKQLLQTDHNQPDPHSPVLLGQAEELGMKEWH